MLIDVEEIRASLKSHGYFVGNTCVDVGEAERYVINVGRSLGELFVPSGCDSTRPIIRTSPSDAELAAPFDRPESIGWHGDFATYENRPALSLSFVTRPDPHGGTFGAW